MSKFRLPKPISTATDEEYKQYMEQFDPAGDRRVLAQEILRLRALGRQEGMAEDALVPVAASAPARVVKVNPADDALI